MSNRWSFSFALAALLSTALMCGRAFGDDATHPSLRVQALPALPADASSASLGVHDGTAIVATESDVFALRKGAAQWEKMGALENPRVNGAAASVADGVMVIGGASSAGASDEVTLLSIAGSQLKQRALPKLPRPLVRAAATSIGKKVYVAAGDSAAFFVLDLAADAPGWRELPSWPGAATVSAPALVGLQNVVYLFGLSGEKAVAYAYEPRTGWKERAPPPVWSADAADAAVPFGHSHIFVFGAAGASAVPTYHTITDKWLNFPLAQGETMARVDLAAGRGGESIVIAGDRALSIAPLPIKTNYGWWDHAVVAAYLMAMVGMGWYFAGREKNTSDYFRGGRRVPWWATGMSLFATGASAISLMSMRGKAYATDWDVLLDQHLLAAGAAGVDVLPRAAGSAAEHRDGE